MRNPAELELKWSGPALLSEDAQALEAHFAMSLPSDYLRFLSIVNGGVPTLNCYDYIFIDGKQSQVSVGDLHRVTADHEDLGGVWKNTLALREDMAEAMRSINVVAVGRDGSINPIYLDMSATPPTVHILYLDYELIDCKLADSFEQFIDGLKME